MIKYRITKYNPIFRNIDGNYMKDEWTSFDDIGNIYNNQLFTLEEYIETENNYIKVILEILNNRDIKGVFITELEKYRTLEELNENNSNNKLISSNEVSLFGLITEGYVNDISKLRIIIKLILRELLWCRFEDGYNNLVIEFGYDYYMYVNCNFLSDELIEKIMRLGLFVEVIND